MLYLCIDVQQLLLENKSITLICAEMHAVTLSVGISVVAFD